MKKQKINSQTIAAIGVMAALVFITTKFMRIPIPVGAGKTQIHVGNSMCILSGLLFGPVTGGLSAGIGTALVDLMDPRWAPEFWISFINKFVMSFTVGTIANLGKNRTVVKRGIEFFFEAVEEKLNCELENILTGHPADEDFFIWVEEQSYKMSCEAYKRSLDLSGKK